MSKRKRLRKQWNNAPFVLADQWPNGDVKIKDDIRFTRPLTTAEILDGSRNGWSKYAVQKP